MVDCQELERPLPEVVLDVTPPRTVECGGRTAFTCTALSGNLSSGILLWNRDGAPLKTGATVDIIEGSITSTLILKDVQFQDAGLYSCSSRQAADGTVSHANTSLIVIGTLNISFIWNPFD